MTATGGDVGDDVKGTGTRVGAGVEAMGGCVETTSGGQ